MLVGAVAGVLIFLIYSFGGLVMKCQSLEIILEGNISSP